MTQAQIGLLKKCILHMRSAEYTQDELVEVGWINGVNPKTAKALVDAGILVYDMPINATEHTSGHVRFPTLKEIEGKDA